MVVSVVSELAPVVGRESDTPSYTRVNLTLLHNEMPLAFYLRLAAGSPPYLDLLSPCCQGRLTRPLSSDKPGNYCVSCLQPAYADVKQLMTIPREGSWDDEAVLSWMRLYYNPIEAYLQVIHLTDEVEAIASSRQEELERLYAEWSALNEAQG